MLGAASAALTTFAMYPLTQIYQVEEDSRRGDRTLCVVFGADRGLRISQAAMIAAGVISVALALRYFSRIDAVILTVAFAGLAWRVGQFRKQYASLTGSEAFHAVLRFSGVPAHTEGVSETMSAGDQLATTAVPRRSWASEP